MSWADAYAELRAADGLSAGDLERLATAAYLTGRDDESFAAWGRAHQEWLRVDRVDRAVRAAFWLSLLLLLRGDTARSSGWLARAERLVEKGRLDGVERGYVLALQALHRLFGADSSAGYPLFVEAAAIADRFGDADTSALCRLSMGEILIQQREAGEGVRLLDEVMTGATVGEVSPIVTGILYCATIMACQSIFDLRRAAEWTAALTEWSAAQPGLVPFRGQCLVHRSQIMQLRGDWPDAADEAQRACDLLGDPGNPGMGLALYQLGELHRLRGAYEAAERSYQDASEWGQEPQPGLSLLLLAQGRPDAARAAIQRVVDETRDWTGRCRLLGPYVEIMLAVGDLGAAAAGAEELAGLASEVRAPLLDATSATATGAVALVRGDARAALEALRTACRAWQALQAPYESAQVRVLIGLACRRLSDYETARMHLDAARSTFGQLGAITDLRRLDRLLVQAAPDAAGLLSRRELEVLGEVAAGSTNREIAGKLFISEKTVARHVSNILTKLGLQSRSAATAYAYEHELV